MDTKHACVKLGLDYVLKMYTLLGEFTFSYILHTRVFGTYLLGVLFTLHKRL
jgi:hypothetical protein